MTGVRERTRREFLDELVAVTNERTASEFLYLMLEEHGRIGVQWEQPGVDHLREYRIVEADGPGCPHCAIIEAIAKLVPLLPLDLVRMDRAQRQYLTALRAGLRPTAAFARQSADRRLTWLSDCHGTPANPHTDADCVAHRAVAPAADPLAESPALPAALLALLGGDAEAAAADVRDRLDIIRNWRDAAREVAGDRTETQPTWTFLRTGSMLGVPIGGVPAAVVALRPGAPAVDRPIADLVGEARLRGGQEFQGGLFLVPDPDLDGRMPVYFDAVDVLTGQPVRTIRLPVGEPALSRPGRGVLLLYQARYAMGLRYVPGPAKPLNYWEHEAALHIFEFGLLRAVAGDAYQAAVRSFLDALVAEGSLLERPQNVLDRRQRAALGRVFDGADEREVHLWGSVAYRNAIQLALGSHQAFVEYLRARAS
ncbi:hypothetical protein [Micromonospora sp. WMMD812]|uniref:hypothetical protein n=1 Tax=Micromonospora sp. WMMD812 TaxID=3015152 RepID=UPI00248C903F|nr:hypothetical protein [Micromonospora sp. WMMD812]WBB69205.1 hypothetical protein O7603_07610 [Micromonospora sp. WMMD812]